MRLNNINDVGNACSGCGACYAICSKNAICVTRGFRGEVFYRANRNCVDCGKCIKVCPVKKAQFYEEVNFFYRGISKHRNVKKKSSSGGIAYEMAARVISEAGIIYAAAWDFESQTLRHTRIDSIQKLPIMQGSKYVCSVIDKTIYLKILEDVKVNKVLFIGCPCQVSAIRNMVGTNSNLMCIDLVCHGVPSTEMFEKQLKRLNMSSIEEVSFRRGVDFILDLKDSMGNIYSQKGYDNPYYSLFLSFSSLRENCYSCIYAQRKRVGDLTIGDFYENDEGYSCVLANSAIGRELIKKTRENIEYEERNVILLKENDALNHPTVKNEKVDVFTKRYNKYGLYFAYYRTFYKFVLKRMARKILGDKLYYSSVKFIKKYAHKGE